MGAVIEGVEELVGGEDADGEGGEMFAEALFEPAKAVGEWGCVGVLGAASKGVFGGREVNRDVSFVDEGGPAGGGGEVAVGEKNDPPGSAALFGLDIVSGRRQAGAGIFMQLEHLSDAHSAAEASGCAGENGVYMAFIGRDETPGLDVGNGGEDLALASQLIGFGVHTGALIEGFREVAVRWGCRCRRGHDDVLETHGRAHVRRQVEGRRVGRLVQHGGAGVNVLEEEGVELVN